MSPEEESLVSLIDALEERHAALDDEVDAMARGAGGGARSDSAPARALKREKLRVRDRLALARRALAELRAPRIVLGEGAEGEVLLARGSDTGRLAAVKVVRADGADGERRLQREVSVLRALAHARGFPDVMYFGPAGGKGGAGHLCAVMTLCGPSLERLSWETAGGGGLSAPTALALAAQAVERLRDLHAAGYAHRDVSPTNLLMGTCDERNTLFLLDMGLAVRVKDGPSACGELRADERDSRGADAFVAAAVDEGGSAEAADDVEMLAWAMAWLLSGGQLPWACGADVGDALSRAAHKRRCARDAACFVDWLDAEGNVRIEEAERAVFSTLAGVAAEAQDARAEGRAVRYDAVLALLKEAGGDQGRLCMLARVRARARRLPRRVAPDASSSACTVPYIAHSRTRTRARARCCGTPTYRCTMGLGEARRVMARGWEHRARVTPRANECHQLLVK